MPNFNFVGHTLSYLEKRTIRDKYRNKQVQLLIHQNDACLQKNMFRRKKIKFKMRSSHLYELILRNSYKKYFEII